MLIREKMTPRFTQYPRTTPISQVVQDLRTHTTEFYIVIEDRTDFTVVDQNFLKSKLAASADDFGEAVMKMTLVDIDGLWTPQPTVNSDGDYQTAFGRLHPGDTVPVVENAKLVGILAYPRRGAIGSSALGTLYGPRFALFDEKSSSDKPLPTRQCPNCGKTIDFYKPRRVGEKIERHCPNCDFLIPEAA